MQNLELILSELFLGSITALHTLVDVLAANKKVRLASTMSSEHRRREDRREQSSQEDTKSLPRIPQTIGEVVPTRGTHWNTGPPHAACCLPRQGAWWELWTGTLAGNRVLVALGVRQRSPSQTLLLVTAQPVHHVPAESQAMPWLPACYTE